MRMVTGFLGPVDTLLVANERDKALEIGEVKFKHKRLMLKD